MKKEKSAEKKKVRLQRALDEAAHKVKVQASVAAKARVSADQNVLDADEMAEYAEAERDADTLCK